MESAIGKEIEIKLFKPLEKQKEYLGILEKFDKDNIYLEKNKVIERKNISLIKLKFNWN